MSVSLKCAACGAAVEFEEVSATAEETCPGCASRVRQRLGDAQMAIPVSMALPEAFQQVDLDSVSHKADVLVERYRRRQAVTEKKDLDSEYVLAKALEILATSLQHLEERLDRSEGGAGGRKSARNGGDREGLGGERTEGASASDQKAAGGEEEVVQLQPDEGPRTKAHPVDVPVLVRREAAKLAREYRRERHSQRVWDPHGEPQQEISGFRWLMSSYPRATFLTTFVGTAALAVLTTLLMQGMFEERQEMVPDYLRPVEQTVLNELWAEDPSTGQAEAMARGFLNATSARAAAPFIYEADRIKEKLDRHYRAIASPSDYELTLKSQATDEEGRRIFVYRVLVEGEVPRMLVVLPEGHMPKVFWEFFAEVGDYSWEAFLDARPAEPSLMRVWATRSETYHPPYTADDWQSYLLHDQAQRRRVYAYVERGTGPDWLLANALKKDPVQFERHSAVMAQVRMSFIEAKTDAAGEAIYVAEIEDVPATSWLPERFLPRDGEN